MKLILSIAAITISLLFSGTAALAGEGALKGVFEGRYAAMKSAMADRNPKAIAALLSPDFASEDVSGKTETSEQMIRQVCALPRDPNKISATTVLSVQIAGETASVMQRYHMSTTKATDGAVKQAVELDTLSSDIWVKSNGVWLLRRTATNQLDYKINGRLAVHKERSK